MQDWSFIYPVTAYRYQEDLKTYKHTIHCVHFFVQCVQHIHAHTYPHTHIYMYDMHGHIKWMVHCQSQYHDGATPFPSC